MRSTLIQAAPRLSAFVRMSIQSEVTSLVLYFCGDRAQIIAGAVIAIDGGKCAGVLR